MVLILQTVGHWKVALITCCLRKYYKPICDRASYFSLDSYFHSLEHEVSADESMTLPYQKTDTLSLNDSIFSPIHMQHQSRIHQLPVELFQQILLLIVNDVSNCPSIFKLINTRISGNFSSPPLVFTRVCRLWRIIAHSTTGLWSRIHVALSGGDEPLKPFLPCLLQCWLARSGSRPLTIHINRVRSGPAKCTGLLGHTSLSQADSQLLEILQTESRRWETVISVFRGNEWPSSKLDTPQLRALECGWSMLEKFNTSNLRRLYISIGITTSSFPTCKKLQHLNLQYASPTIIRSLSVTFPLLETIVVLHVAGGHEGTSSHLVTYPCLESLTLPLPLDLDKNPHWPTAIFDGLNLPVLRKLTLVGYPTKLGVDRIVAALKATATCNLQVIDFRTFRPQDEVDVDVVEPLLSVAREISVCSALLRCRASRD